MRLISSWSTVDTLSVSVTLPKQYKIVRPSIHPFRGQKKLPLLCLCYFPLPIPRYSSRNSSWSIVTPSVPPNRSEEAAVLLTLLLEYRGCPCQKSYLRYTEVPVTSNHCHLRPNGWDGYGSPQNIVFGEGLRVKEQYGIVKPMKLQRTKVEERNARSSRIKNTLRLSHLPAQSLALT